MPVTLVIAGNYREYEEYIRAHEGDFAYVSREADLRGVRGCKVAKVGNWLEIPLWHTPNIEWLIQKAQEV